MKALQRYFLPVCFSAAFLVTLFLMDHSAPERARSKPDEEYREPGVMALPAGRVLYVVIEETGAYVGEELVPFTIIESYFLTHRASLRPNHVIILGADLARYGQAVQVYDTIRKVFNVPTTIITVPVAIGTRRGPIEVHANFWEY